MTQAVLPVASPLTGLRAPTPLVTRVPGCHDCPHWQRVGSALGECLATGGPSLEFSAEAGEDRTGWLTSYAYCCRKHPRFNALSP
jgi:hypothetical protein